MIVAVVAAVLVAAAGARSTALDVTAMTVQAADVPGAKQVSSGRAKAAGYDASYQRSFVYGKPSGSAGVVYIRSQALLGRTPTQPTADLRTLTRELRSTVGKKQFLAALARTAGVPTANVKLGALRTPKLGDGALEVPVSIVTKAKARIFLTLIYMRLDRVLIEQIVDGLRPVGAPSERLVSRSASHIADELTPVSTAVPTITGTAQQGQTLTASAGTWTVTATYGYQWQRCDATGANCADVPGATAATYAVTDADVGATLRVVVTATDRFGSAQATSLVTAVVS
jgi:hypothetical protein